MPSRWIAACTGSILFAVLLCAPNLGAAESRNDELLRFLRGMERFGMHGALLVEEAGEVLVHEGFGIADHQTGRRISKDTLFDIGSLSKQFTAAAVLTLQMNGKLSVSDPISEHLEDVPEDKRSITLHHLMSNSSGLPYMPSAGSPLTLPLSFEPGARFQYSNPGFSLLADVIEAVSGEDHRAYLQREVFEKAGMKSTLIYGSAPWPSEDVASSYTEETDYGPVSEKEFEPVFRGAGGVVTTVHDLLLWEKALRDRAVLDEASFESFFMEHIRNPGAPTGYGYGWFCATTPRGTRIRYHSGNFGGFNSDYRRYLDEDRTVVFLSNHFLSGQSMRDAVMNDISYLLSDKPVVFPPDVEEVAESDVTDWLGTHELEEARLTVAYDDGGLRVRARGQRAVDRIFKPEPTDDERGLIDHCGAAAKAVLRGIAEGNSDPLRAHISRSLPFEGAWAMLSGMGAAHRAELGAVEKVEIIGTALAGRPGAARTFATVHYEEGEVPAQVSFAGGKILHVSEQDIAPERRFFRDATGAFVAFDIFADRTVTLDLSAASEQG